MTTENLILHTLGMFKDGLTLHFLEHELRKVSKQEINKALKALLDKGLIKKEPQFESSYKYKLKENTK